MWRRVLELEEGEASGAHGEAAYAVAPLLLGALELDVLVDADGDADGHDGVEPLDDEHDEQAEAQAEQRQRPVVVLVARTPAGRLEQRLQGARHVHEAVAQEEEHGDERRQVVHIAQQDAALAQQERDEESAQRLAAVTHRQRLEEWYDVVARDRLEEARRARQALQAGAERGQEGAHHDHPLVGPGEQAHDELLVDAVAELVAQQQAVDARAEQQHVRQI